MKYPLLHFVSEQKVIKTRFLAHSLILLSLPLFLTSCKKTITDRPTIPVIPPSCDTCLPDITSSGKGTFGCKVNGRNWLPEGSLLYPDVYASYGQSMVLGISSQNNSKSEFFRIQFGKMSDTGVYRFPDLNLNTALSEYTKVNKDGISYDFYYQSRVLDNGFVHITSFEFSPTGFVSGTFAFDLYQNDFKDTIHITDGRFDIRF